MQTSVKVLSRETWSIALAFGGLSLLGCAAPVADGEAMPLAPTPLDVCDEARLHLSSCVGAEWSEDLVGMSCDVEAAEAVVGQPCETLEDVGKADFFGDFLCRLGVLRYCVMPSCEAPGAFAAEAGSCAELIELEDCGQCDYYLCRDAGSSAQCGEDGYYQGFGYEYCNRFLQVTEPRLSAAGQAWSARVRPCLMQALEADASDALSCRDLQQLAFDSHPGCYIEAGFCSLPITDWILILNTVDREDIDLRQILSTGIGCLSGR